MLPGLLLALCLVSFPVTAATWQKNPPPFPDPVPAILSYWQTTAPTLINQMRQYAIAQSASSQTDIDTLTAHELIHVEQAQLQAWILPDGKRISWPQNWPGTTQLKALPASIASRTPHIHDNYLARYPNHTPGDLLNEIHAYTLTLPHICHTDPAAANAHHTPHLREFLLTLDTLTTQHVDIPSANRQAIAAISQLARHALYACQKSDRIPSSNNK